MSHSKVEVARDHVRPSSVRTNDLSSIDTIEVADQGPGIPPEELPAFEDDTSSGLGIEVREPEHGVIFQTRALGVSMCAELNARTNARSK